MDDPNICSKCIGNAEFNKWIRDYGRRGQCGIDRSHGRGSKVVPASEFAKTVDVFFRDNFGIGSEQMYVTEDSDNPSYEQRGAPYDEIMMEHLLCDEGVIRAIDPHLPDASGHDIAQGDQPFYDSTQLYENLKEAEERERDREREAEEEYWYQNQFSIQWQEFCQTVIYKQRFFKVTDLLDNLFGDLDHFEHGVIKPVYLLPKGLKIFRARLIGENLTPEALSQNPAMALGPPPREKARIGRMNVDFIPLFYGAFSEETAIAEVRPSLETEIAIGEFKTLCDLKIFDFTVFAKSIGEHSKDVTSHSRYDFIDQLEREISKPVRAWDKVREYIPTQIVSEYIRERFGCDGIIYKSSMMKDKAIDTRNITLFNKRHPFLHDEGAALGFVKLEVKEVSDVRYVVHKPPF